MTKSRLGNLKGPLLPREKKILNAFKRMHWGRTSDARRAIGADYSDWYLKRLIARGRLRKVGRDKYEVIDVTS
jgi:hypothetical protein